MIAVRNVLSKAKRKIGKARRVIAKNPVFGGEDQVRRPVSQLGAKVLYKWALGVKMYRCLLYVTTPVAPWRLSVTKGEEVFIAI